MLKRMFILFTIATLLFAMTGCIRIVVDPKESNPDETEATATKNTSGEDEEEAPSEPSVIVVGYTLYAPYNYFDETGELVGFDTELAKAVFEGMGYQVRFQEIDWSYKYDLLNNGTVDCVWNAFTCNTVDDDGVMRSNKVDFSYNYTDIRSVVVVHKDSGLYTARDLEGKSGVAQKDSSAEWYSASFDGTIVISQDNQTQCLAELISGNTDFAVLDELFAREFLSKSDYSNLVILDDLSSTVEQFAVAFKKGSNLTAQVNEQLEKLAKDGTIAEIAEKYGLQYVAVTDFTNQK